jgi:hypothetical protein
MCFEHSADSAIRKTMVRDPQLVLGIQPILGHSADSAVHYTKQKKVRGQQVTMMRFRNTLYRNSHSFVLPYQCNCEGMAAVMMLFRRGGRGFQLDPITPLHAAANSTQRNRVSPARLAVCNIHMSPASPSLQQR